MSAKLTLAIDFDGVIHDYQHPVEGRKMGAPLPGAKEAIDKLNKQGHLIIIHTVRPSKHVADWLDYYDIRGMVWDMPGKPNADLYIDDRAVHHTEWPNTLEAIKTCSNMLTVVERRKRIAKSRAGTNKTIKSRKVVK